MMKAFIIIAAILVGISVISLLIWNLAGAKKDGNEEISIDKEKMRELQFPLIYNISVSNYRLLSRVAKLQTSIDGIKPMDFVGAKPVINQIIEIVDSVDEKIKDERFNAFLQKNPKMIEEAAKKLALRLTRAEEACELIAQAITCQECGNGRESENIVKEAELILERQYQETQGENLFLNMGTEPDAPVLIPVIPERREFQYAENAVQPAATENQEEPPVSQLMC